MLNLSEIQDQLFDEFEARCPFPVYEQGIPDADTVKKVNGVIEPYVTLQFGSTTPRSDGQTFVGARTFDYDLVIQVQVVAGTPRQARRIMSHNVYDALVGMSLDWTAEVKPGRYGGMFPLTTSNAATEAYQYASGFIVTIQMNETV